MKFALPLEIQQLESYVQANPDSLDITFVSHEDPDLHFFWGKEKLAHFYFFAKTRTGSLIGFWSPDGSFSGDVCIVWIDSEKIPVSVFARSAVDFLSLLHFGSGIIYDILITMKFDPASYSRVFDKKYLKRTISQESKEHSPYFKNFKKWLEKEGITEPENPLLSIEESIESNPNLEKWLSDRK